MGAWRVHGVVVAFHAPGQLSRCLSGLERRIAVTVVDNSSSSDVAAVARRHGANYVDAGANRGFAGGVNIALSRLVDQSADVLLLNPDAVVTPSSVAALAQFLHLPEHGRLAATAPRLVGTDGVEQRVSWPFPSPRRMWAEAVGLGRLPTRQIFLAGAVLLLRREAVLDVGPFDERFFLYAEEADWQRRARERGWASALCPDAVAEHVGGGTSMHASRRETLFHAAQETYIRKWYGRSGWLAYRVAACLGAAARALVLRHERRKEAARRTLLYLRGPRRCATLRME